MPVGVDMLEDLNYISWFLSFSLFTPRHNLLARINSSFPAHAHFHFMSVLFPKLQPVEGGSICTNAVSATVVAGIYHMIMLYDHVAPTTSNTNSCSKPSKASKIAPKISKSKMKRPQLIILRRGFITQFREATTQVREISHFES